MATQCVTVVYMNTISVTLETHRYLIFASVADVGSIYLNPWNTTTPMYRVVGMFGMEELSSTHLVNEESTIKLESRIFLMMLP